MAIGLPIIKLGRKFYFKDERLQQLRNVKDPFDTESIELAYSPTAKIFFEGGEMTPKTFKLFEKTFGKGGN